MVSLILSRMAISQFEIHLLFVSMCQKNIYKGQLCPQIFRSAPYAVLIVARCILVSWLYVPRCL